MRRGALQTTLDALKQFSYFRWQYETRSGIAFLTAACARVGVDLALDTAAADAYLDTVWKLPARPYGIPASHAWWDARR